MSNDPEREAEEARQKEITWKESCAFLSGCIFGAMIAVMFLSINGCASTEQTKPYFEKSSRETQIA